jgi:hypothetical protein
VRLAQDTNRGVPDVLEHLDRDAGRPAAGVEVGEIHHATMRIGQPGLVARLCSAGRAPLRPWMDGASRTPRPTSRGLTVWLIDREAVAVSL